MRKCKVFSYICNVVKRRPRVETGKTMMGLTPHKTRPRIRLVLYPVWFGDFVFKIMEETWRSIRGCDGLYEGSDLGRIKSLERNVELVRYGKPYKAMREGRVLKARANRCGYSYVGLCKDGKVKSFTVHRLIALAFLPNPENKPCVNHIDGDKTNNNVWN